MKRELLRIEPVSAIRVGFFLGFLFGVCFGLFEGLFLKAISGSVGSMFLPAEASGIVNLSAGGIILLALVTGLVLSLFSAATGALFALFYNLTARLFGGWEFTVSDEPKTAASADHAADETGSDDDHE